MLRTAERIEGFPLTIGQVFIIRYQGFPGGSDGKESACHAGDVRLIPGLGRSPGEGNGHPLQYSCLENSIDRGAWWGTVHWVAKSQTGLSTLCTFEELGTALGWESSPGPKLWWECLQTGPGSLVTSHPRPRAAPSSTSLGACRSLSSALQLISESHARSVLGLPCFVS